MDIPKFSKDDETGYDWVEGRLFVWIQEMNEDRCVT